MKNLLNTIQRLKRYVIHHSDFRGYYQSARQSKNLNGFNAYLTDWFNHLKDNPQFIALLDKPYSDSTSITINGNIIDMDSLFTDYQSDLRSFYGLNPNSL
jgi:hypothetical protein